MRARSGAHLGVQRLFKRAPIANTSQHIHQCNVTHSFGLRFEQAFTHHVRRDIRYLHQCQALSGRRGIFRAHGNDVDGLAHQGTTDSLNRLYVQRKWRRMQGLQQNHRKHRQSCPTHSFHGPQKMGQFALQHVAGCYVQQEHQIALNFSRSNVKVNVQTEHQVVKIPVGAQYFL